MSLTSTLRIGALLTLLTTLLSGCGTSIERISADETTDLSGEWNDTDSRLVSDEMIRDALSRAWISKYTSKHGKPPVVIVGSIRNLSHEHINLNTFVADMERALINSGEVEFVASSTERNEIREERREQELHASDETRNEMGQETGADFMLKGSINTILDSSGKTTVKYYQVDLTLISMADNRKVWVGQKKIKKVVEKSSFRF